MDCPFKSETAIQDTSLNGMSQAQTVGQNGTRESLNSFMEQGNTTKLHALAVFAETNNLREASRQSGVAHTTIFEWVHSDEGAAVVEQIRTAVRSQAAWTLVENTITALNLVNQRLKAGTDPHVLKNGCIVMRPISLKDAVMAAAVSQDKLAMLTGMLEGTKQVDKRLESIASRLISKHKTLAPNTPNEIKPLVLSADASPYME